MVCKRCGVKMYERVGRCLRCGYSEADVKRAKEREIEGVTVSKNPLVNYCYQKFFGQTHKRVVKRLLKYVLTLLFCGWLFYHFFLYIDLSHGCFITLRPAITELSNASVKKGIRYLKANFPNQYQLFCDNVSSIDPNIACGGLGGGCFYHGKNREDPQSISISTTFGDYLNAAKVIIHETCHAIQYRENRSPSETECHEKDSVIPWH